MSRKQEIYLPFTEVKLFGDMALENYQLTGNQQPSAERCAAGRLYPPMPFQPRRFR